ncbi:MAG: tRNA (cytidine(34)-2'-O)-methyltransferase [Syntrophobacteraceae bacterium]
MNASSPSCVDGKENGYEVQEPGSSLQVALYQPQIPQNTGNIARTCAATHTPLHLVEPLGFRLTDRYLKRAGLDYWPSVSLRIHPGLESLRAELSSCRMIYFSTHAHRPYYDFRFQSGDCLIFGSESRGLPLDIIESEEEKVLRIPIDRTRVRSLNLATTVGVALFEAMRQLIVQAENPFYAFSC